MLCQNMDEDDLRLEIISLRKHITRVCSENQVLKVKVRKLQDEMIKRDKQLDEFLTSKSFSGLNKKLQDKSASVILNLKLKNDKLEQIIVEKDITIKRLQNTIHTAKLYNANSLNQKFVSKGIECLLLNGKIDLKKKKISKMINLHIPNMQMDKCEDEDDGILQKEMKTTFTTGISDFRHDGYHNAEQEKEILLFPEGYGSMNSFNNVDENFFDFDTNLDNLQEKDYSATFHNEAEENFMNRGKNLENNNEIFFSRDGMSLDNGEKVFNVPEKVFDMSESCVSNLLSPKTINVDMKETKQEALENQIRNGEKDYRIGTHSFDTLKVTFFEKIDDISSHSKETVDEKYNAEKTKDDEYSEYHEEMKQLHVHLMDMMSQVDYLKDTISQMKEDQDRNDENLKPKDGNIKELIKEIDKSQDNKLAVSPKTKRISNIKHNDSEEKDCTKSLKNSEKNSHSAVKKFHSTKHSKLAKSKSSVSDHKNEKKTLKNLFKPQDADKKLNTENLKNKKSDRKIKEATEIKGIFGIGNGDVPEIPYYRYNPNPINKKTMNEGEYEELD